MDILLKEDVSKLMFYSEKTFWNTHAATKEVSYEDRFHGVGFIEKLETNPNVHILLFFPDKVSFAS